MHSFLLTWKPEDGCKCTEPIKLTVHELAHHERHPLLTTKKLDLHLFGWDLQLKIATCICEVLCSEKREWNTFSTVKEMVDPGCMSIETLSLTYVIWWSHSKVTKKQCSSHITLMSIQMKIFYTGLASQDLS